MTTKMLQMTVRRKRKRPFICDSERVIKLENPGTSKYAFKDFRRVRYTPILDSNLRMESRVTLDTYRGDGLGYSIHLITLE